MTKPLANPIAFTGQSPPWSLTQLDANFSAIQSAINDTLTYNNYFVDQSGVANSIVLSIPVTLAVGLTAGTKIDVKVKNANTGATTITINSLTAQSVLYPDGQGMAWGQLLAGGLYTFEYDGTNFQLLGTITQVRENVTSGVAGSALFKIGICAGTEGGWTSNPSGTTDRVALYLYNNSSSGRNRIWAINTNVDVVSGNIATAWSAEFDMNVGTANAPDPHSANHALGVDIVSGGPFAPSAGLSIYGTTLANRWKHGIWLDFIGSQTGSTLIKAGAATINGGTQTVDFGIDFSPTVINFQGVRIGNTPAAQVAPIALRQFANGQVGLFVQRFTDTAPTGNLIQAVNAANGAVLFQVDASGNTTVNEALFSVAALRTAASQNTGSLTATYTGFNAGTTATVNWTRSGYTVELMLSAVTGTSNAVTMTWAAATLPAEIRPATAQTVIMAVTDNGAVGIGQVTINTDGSATFGKTAGAAAAFTNSGTKGIGSTMTLTYIAGI